MTSENLRHRVSNGHIQVKHCTTRRFSVLTHPEEVDGPQTTSCHVLQPPTPRTPVHIFLDVDCSYSRESILKAFDHSTRKKMFGITLGPGEGMDPIAIPYDCDFQWAEYERIDWTAVLEGRHGASSFCIRKGLSRKAQLAYYTHRYVCKNPTSILSRALPPTVIIETWSAFDDVTWNRAALDGVERGVLVDMIDSTNTRDSPNLKERLLNCLLPAKVFMNETESECDRVWILKGSTTNKGSGIHLVYLHEQLVDLCWSESEIREWVLQRYISTPLLLRGRKFHVRAYALAVSALRVYLSLDCLALRAGARYRQNSTDKFAHITNTAFQELDPGFKEEKCVLAWDEATVVPILLKDKTCKSEREAKSKVNHVLACMQKITSELFRAYETEFGVFAPVADCFEHYGLDFIVDDQWQVYLLEVNPGPDFKQTGRLSDIIQNLMSSTIDICFLEDPRRRKDRIGNMVLVYNNPRFRQGARREEATE